MTRLIFSLIISVLFAQPGWADDSLYTRVNTVLCAARSSDDRNYWVAHVADDPNGSSTAWPYWVHRMETGDGVGKAPVPDPLCAPVPPSPGPPPAPVPPPVGIDYSPLLHSILSAQQQLLEAQTQLLVVAKDTNTHVVNIDRTFAQSVGAAAKWIGTYLAPAIAAYVAGKTL